MNFCTLWMVVAAQLLGKFNASTAPITKKADPGPCANQIPSNSFSTKIKFEKVQNVTKLSDNIKTHASNGGVVFKVDLAYQPNAILSRGEIDSVFYLYPMDIFTVVEYTDVGKHSELYLKLNCTDDKLIQSKVSVVERCEIESTKRKFLGTTSIYDPIKQFTFCKYTKKQESECPVVEIDGAVLVDERGALLTDTTETVARAYQICDEGYGFVEYGEIRRFPQELKCDTNFETLKCEQMKLSVDESIEKKKISTKALLISAVMVALGLCSSVFRLVVLYFSSCWGSYPRDYSFLKVESYDDGIDNAGGSIGDVGESSEDRKSNYY